LNRPAPSPAPRREKLVLGALGALGLAILAFALFGDQGWREVRRLRAERDQLSAEIEHLTRRQEALRRQVADLKDDPLAIEARARSDLGMVKPGETVYLLPEHHAPKP